MKTRLTIIATLGSAAILTVGAAGAASAAPAPAASAAPAAHTASAPPAAHAAPAAQAPAKKSQSTTDDRTRFFAGPMNIRYINKTDQKVCVDAVGTRMDWKGCLQPGATSGYAQGMAWSGTDIWSDVTYANGDKVTMWAKNPEMGYPMIGFGTGWGEHQGYKVGETADWQYGGHDYTITRTDDGGYWKTFDIQLTR